MYSEAEMQETLDYYETHLKADKERIETLRTENKALRNLNKLLKNGNKALMEANALLREDVKKLEKRVDYNASYKRGYWDLANKNCKLEHELIRICRDGSDNGKLYKRQRDTWMKLYADCRKRACPHDFSTITVCVPRGVV